MSTQEVWILLLQHQNGFFGDCALENSVGPHHWLTQPERHDDVMPGRIRGLGNVGRRRKRLGVGMGMDHTDEFDAAIFRVAIGPQMHLWVDCVDPARRRPIRAWVPRINNTRFAIGARPTTDQSAGLIGKTIGEVGKKVIEDRGRKLKHAPRLPPYRFSTRVRSSRHSVGGCHASLCPKGPIR